MARNKYTYYAEIARKEGWVWIATVFEETAGNEKAHAQEELEEIKDKAEMTNTYDIHALGDTAENLKNAVAGEIYEYTTMYPEFEKAARKEGNSRAANLFAHNAKVEKNHADRYAKLLQLLESNTLYKTDGEIEWRCLNCGYVHKGKFAPEKCPLCKKPQGWYEGLGVVK
jgi:rubrerythrin